jgi:hypothetical protein
MLFKLCMTNKLCDGQLKRSPDLEHFKVIKILNNLVSQKIAFNFFFQNIINLFISNLHNMCLICLEVFMEKIRSIGQTVKV